MNQSNKTIIESLPNFIAYCRAVGLSSATQENYKRFLEKFLVWLKQNNLEDLKPHELNEKHIADYKNYLLSPTLNHNTGKFLKPNTQHYYLIVLRALLGYFGVQGIVSLVPSKITLPRVNKCPKSDLYLDGKGIQSLLGAPDSSNIIGLRDRAILNVIISTGFKVRRICGLNKGCLHELPENIYSPINEYLEKRSDSLAPYHYLRFGII